MQPHTVRPSVIVFNQLVAARTQSTENSVTHPPAGRIECISLIDDDEDSENEGLVDCVPITSKQTREELSSAFVNSNNQADNEININTNDESHNPDVVCDSTHHQSDDQNEASGTANDSTDLHMSSIEPDTNSRVSFDGAILNIARKEEKCTEKKAAVDNRAGNVVIKCHERFSKGKKSIQEHEVTNYHREKIVAVFKCRKCPISFARKQSHQRHMDLRHSHKSPLECPMPNCSATFTKAIFVERHTASAHRNKPRSCSEQLNRKSFPKKHSANTLDDNIAYCCHLCKRSYSFRNSLRSHITLKHLRQPTQCPIATCSKRYAGP